MRDAEGGLGFYREEDEVSESKSRARLLEVLGRVLGEQGRGLEVQPGEGNWEWSSPDEDLRVRVYALVDPDGMAHFALSRTVYTFRPFTSREKSERLYAPEAEVLRALPVLLGACPEFPLKGGAVTGEGGWAYRHRCQDCGGVWPEVDLLPIRHLEERVAPGEPVPSGECPLCGALCHEEED